MTEVRHLLVDLKSGGTRPALPRSPVLSSNGVSWGGVLLEQHTGGEAENLDVASQTHAITVQLSNSGPVEWKQEGSAPKMVRKVPGQVSVFPAFSPASIRTRNTGELLIVALSPKFLKLATHEMAASEFELKPMGPIDEPFLKTVALALHSELKAGNPGGRCYGETLATALAVHLVRHHATSRGLVRASEGGLAPAQFRRAVDYMHAHLSEDISLQRVSEAAGLSTFHFARLFKRSAGVSPHQYLIRLRLERAKELLLSGDSMAQVALQSGFCDQSHFAMHFKRCYGVTPKAFARRVRGR